MDEHPSKCWTNHHSIVEYKGQWYLFNHPGIQDIELLLGDSGRVEIDWIQFE